MKRVILLFAAIMMASTGLWAETQNVSYLYPVYNTEGDPTSGIKEWKTTGINATVLTGSDARETLNRGWYVVTGYGVMYKEGLICKGDVHLILDDGAKLIAGETGINAGPGIEVSGEGNSLTIYGQDNQLGQLVATGTVSAAGIGGGEGGSGSNITINGGIVTANGGDNAAGIGGGSNGSASNITINGGMVTTNGGDNAAGIGGGEGGSGSNITINGGTVTSNGGYFAAGIGGGDSGGGSNITVNDGMVTANGGYGAAGIGGGQFANGLNIFVATDLAIKADVNNPPETVITNTGDDLASSLADKQYVKIEKDLNVLKNKAIAEINAAIDGVTDEDIHAIATTAITDINNATSEEQINSIKTFALTKINAIAEILSASQGIKDTDLNNWIDAAINDIKRGSQDATPSIEEIKEQILYMINLFQNGKAEGKADVLGTMGTKQSGPAIEVIDQDGNVLKLYNPKQVKYIKVKVEE
ncbi:MAG: DUF1542 domain-containing protein [Bacteroidales bacterium]|nr:DUF1542 domain-containing protein [Candidatus Sodaliphilus aphodohippi]